VQPNYFLNALCVAEKAAYREEEIWKKKEMAVTL
jgi:hypothetical protein